MCKDELAKKDQEMADLRAQLTNCQAQIETFGPEKAAEIKKREYTCHDILSYPHPNYTLLAQAFLTSSFSTYLFYVSSTFHVGMNHANTSHHQTASGPYSSRRSRSDVSRKELMTKTQKLMSQRHKNVLTADDKLTEAIKGYGTFYKKNRQGGNWL